MRYPTPTGGFIPGKGNMNEIDQLWQAVLMLHTEAHGHIPLQVCTMEPCRSLRYDHHYDQGPVGRTFGPAALSLPLQGGDD